MIQTRFHALAKEELLHASDYYFQINPKLSEFFINSIESSLTRLSTFPQTGTPSVEGTRKIVVKYFPYLIIYKEYESEIIIFAIAHQAQKPHYWISRF